jgi:menaquinone-dependent protoporphyrinogen oxidase
MSKKIIVAYASGSGSTAEVAEAIASELRSRDVQVDVLPAKEILTIEDYGAIILGSSIRVGRWLPDAVNFLEKHAEAMEKVPVAYFTTCITLVEDSEENRQIVEAYMEPILDMVPNVKPVGLGLFAGSLSPSMQAVLPAGGPYGDFRDWDAIREWARDIVPALLVSRTEAADQPVLSGSILSYSDLSGRDLSGTVFRGSDLQRIRLRKAKLRDADLRRSRMSQADLGRADLREARLGWAELDGSNLENCDLRKANLIGARLKNANLRGANLSQAILNGADLSRADLTQCQLVSADLNWAVLTGANLSGADLSRANLGWANLKDADLSAAKFSKARYNAQTLWPDGFDPEVAGCISIMGPY